MRTISITSNVERPRAINRSPMRGFEVPRRLNASRNGEDIGREGNFLRYATLRFTTTTV
jgi:hypothetical protein